MGLLIGIKSDILIDIYGWCFLCADVNECAGMHGCDHHCNNTNGSYHCTCDVGYHLGNDNHSCYGITVHACTCS